jgi:DNA-binding XRE family transcriptional regulator
MPRSLFGRPSNRSYKTAVAQIIRDVKSANKLSNERLAELIGCSETTVFNAENEACDLAAVSLLNIAYAFGEEAIEPVRALYLCAPSDQPTKDGLIRKAIGLLNQAEGME